MQKTLTRLANREHVTIVALGDSNTEITFHAQGRLNWVGLLSAGIFMRYGAGVCTMINSGVCGSTFAQSLDRLDRDVLRFEPNLVIISLGLNDASNGIERLSTFCDEVRQTVRKIESACACEILLRTFNPLVACNGLPHPNAGQPGDLVDRGDDTDGRYAAALVELADELGYPIVDHYTMWKNATFGEYPQSANPNGLWLRMSDAIHPGPIGHQVFYRELAPRFDLKPDLPWDAMGDETRD